MTDERFFLRNAHPIDAAMRTQITEALHDIEQRHAVTILFACESGSRGWGFASPDSDYDVRFIYVNRLPWYLTVSPQRDVIELPISGDLDINGWDLRKALGLLRESNPTLLEWLDSPIHCLPRRCPHDGAFPSLGAGHVFQCAQLVPLCLHGQEEFSRASAG